MDTTAVEQRRQFVRAYQTGAWAMTELCDRYGISRPTGYKWLERWETTGDAGLSERARTPRHCPHRTPLAVAEQVIALRWQYGWGASKLLAVLRTRHPDVVWPTRSTVNAVLARHGLLRKQRRRAAWPHPGAAASPPRPRIKSGRRTSRGTSRRGMVRIVIP